MNPFYLAGEGGLVLILVIVFGVLFSRSKTKKELKASLSRELFLVRVPISEKSEDNIKNEIGKFEGFLSSLSSIKSEVALELAVPHFGEEIHFYFSAGRAGSDSVTKQIQGIWSGASVDPISDDYNIFSPKGFFAAAYVQEKDNYSLPIRTYLDLNLDSFEAILGSFSKINEIGEGAALQLLLRPAPKYAKKTVERFISELKKGKKLDEVFSSSEPLGFKSFISALSPKKDEKSDEPKTIDESSLESLSKKIEKPLFEVNLRVVASSNSENEAQSILDSILTGFNQFGSPKKNQFKVISPKDPRKLVYDFIFRNFREKHSMILSSEEVASLYHFPIAGTSAPKVKWLKSREAPPPSNLPKEGTFIGESSFRGDKEDIFITDADRKRHVYIIGQTGTGKTTLIGSMIIDDILRGKGVGIIDPHGEFAEKTLSRVPESRMNDVIYFEPGDLAKPLGLNMLDFNPQRPEEKTFIVNEMQSIFNKLFSQETMGPMFEQYMRNALLLLMEDMVNEPATLIEVPRVFTDPEFRKRKLARITNPVVVDFWEKEAAKAGGEASLANMTPYITSKFNNFISNDYMRPIIGQTKSAFNFRDVMDEGKILIVNLSKGRIGDINANLLGMVFTGKLLMAALSRVDIPDEKKRRDFNLYIDEFQNFTTDSISTIFSEARKYGLSLTVAHQFIAQLTEAIRDSVFGNVGSQIVMRVGAQDAEFLVKQFEPVFNQNDLLNIDNLNAFAKILIKGQTTQPFNLKVSTKSWEPGNPELGARIKELSRTKYGKDRADIEQDIFKRLRE